MTTAAQLEHLPLDALTPYAKNARTHSAAQLAQLVASIKEFGFTNPVLIDAEGGILAGHGRVLAAQQLGLATVPCVRLGHLSEVQRRAYILADNKLALNADWDEDLLAEEVRALLAMDFNLFVAGFDDSDALAHLDTEMTQLREKEATLRPIRWTRILISIPTDFSGRIADAIGQIRAAGAEVDYAGN